MASYQWIEKQARKLKCRATRYTFLDGILYRREFTLPLLRCLDDEEANYMLRKYMREYETTIWGQGLWRSRRCDIDIFGRPCTKTRRRWQEIAKSAKVSQMSLLRLQKGWLWCHLLGLLHNGDRPNWSFVQRTRSRNTCNCDYRLLYEVDSSGGFKSNHGEKDNRFHLEEHHL